MPSAAAGRSRTFFLRGLKTLLPTLITVSLLLWAWNFLWDQLGRHLIWAVQNLQYQLGGPEAQWGKIRRLWMRPDEYTGEWRWEWWSQLVGVALAVLLVYIVGLLVGNLIGRTFWKLGESLAMKIPVIRAIYPAVKQVTDFLLQDRKSQLSASRVVACRPHASGIWSIGLVTGQGLPPLTAATGEDLVTVFVPSSPTAFSGYVMMVPRAAVIELPMTVEEAMRLLLSGGVLTPKSSAAASDNLPVGFVPPELPNAEGTSAK
jgi:uncharacterized membrane protein